MSPVMSSAPHLARAWPRHAEPLPQRQTPCLARLGALPWVGTLAVEVDGWLVGIRVNTEHAAAVVDEALRWQRVPDVDHALPPHFSVRLAASGDLRNHPRELNLIYRDHEVVARRRDVNELRADLDELIDDLRHLRETTLPVVEAAVLLDEGGRAIVLPRPLHHRLLSLQHVVSACGLRLVPPRTHRVAGPNLGLPSSLPIRSWLVPGKDDRRLTGAQGMYAAFGSVVNRRVLGAGPTLRALAETAADVEFWSLAPPRRPELLRLIHGLTR